MVSSQSFGSSVVSLACITSMCSVQRFPGGHSLRLALGSLEAHSWRFASHGGVTLSRSWLCQKRKSLDIPGTHLH